MTKESAAHTAVFDFGFNPVNFFCEVGAPCFQVMDPVLCVQVFLFAVRRCVVDECRMCRRFRFVDVLFCLGLKRIEFVEGYTVMNNEFHAEVADCLFEKVEIGLCHDCGVLFDLFLKFVECLNNMFVHHPVVRA